MRSIWKKLFGSSDTFYYLQQLPEDLQRDHVLPFLTVPEAQFLALTNQKMHRLFLEKKEVLHRLALPRCILQAVMEGDHEKAESLIQKNPQALEVACDGTDFSGRTFKKITAFQYALWALDRHRWQMILKYLPIEIAAKQFVEHMSESHPPEYVKKHGLHYDFNPLIRSLQKVITQAQECLSQRESRIHWRSISSQALALAVFDWWHEYGELQRKVPAHVAQEFCRLDRALFPTPAFNEIELPRTFSLFSISSAETMQLWFPLVSQERKSVGRFAAVLRGSLNKAYFDYDFVLYLLPVSNHRNEIQTLIAQQRYDCVALQRLRQVRLNELDLLKSSLNEIAVLRSII
ncbi:MAG: hypothetical protein SFW66_01000 [Gammaproteobacteria bacterium]|nr:hypothetical protein [Gammaproteobacteria bacterium]